MVWWLVAMLSWLAGVGWQVNQAQISSWAMSVAVVGMSLLVLAAAWYGRGSAWAKWSKWGVWAFAGLGWGMAQWRAAELWHEQLPPHGVDQSVALRIQVDSMVQFQVPPAGLSSRLRAGSRASFEARVLAYRLPGQAWMTPDQMRPNAWPRRVLVRWQGLTRPDPSGSDVAEHSLVPGQRWEVTARLHAPDGQSNPGGFDAELMQWERGVRALANVRAAEARWVSDSPAWFWQGRVDRFRSAVRDRIHAQVSDPRLAGVLAGLAVGDQGAIDQADWEVFRQTGVAHLVSISGGHVAMFGWLAAWLIQPLWLRTGKLAWRIPSPNAARVGGALAAWMYAVLAGWGVPAQRTVVMLLVFTALRVSGRRWPWPMVWLLAAVAVSWWDPWACLQAGFWLSFVAVGILMSMPSPVRLQPDPKASVMARVWGQGRQALGALWSTQWRVSLGLAPLSLVFFQATSWVSLPANLIAIPVFTALITPLALLGMAWAPVWTLGAAVVQASVGWLTWLAQSAGAMWQVPMLPLWAAAGAVWAGAVWVWPMRMAWRLLSLPLLLPLVWLPQSWRVWPVPEVGEFTVLAADVGQGTAALVQTRSHTLMFDTGPVVGASDAGRRVLVPLLRGLGVSSVDELLLSHGDADHVGGAASVLQAVKVARMRSSLDDAHPLREARDPRGHRIAQHTCVAGQSWNWDGVQFTVLHPTADDLAQREHRSDNALSCVLQVRSQSGRVALLTGDIEARQEADLVAHRTESLRADLLLVPHHGSQTSSTTEFLEAVQPRLSVIQVGRRNRYGHPAPKVLQRYRASGLAFLSTPDCGAVMWRSSGPQQPQATEVCWRLKRPRYWHASPTSSDTSVAAFEQ